VSENGGDGKATARRAIRVHYVDGFNAAPKQLGEHIPQRSGRGYGLALRRTWYRRLACRCQRKEPDSPIRYTGHARHERIRGTREQHGRPVVLKHAAMAHDGNPIP
jgi:hypothetical protein